MAGKSVRRLARRLDRGLKQFPARLHAWRRTVRYADPLTIVAIIIVVLGILWGMMLIDVT